MKTNALKRAKMTGKGAPVSFVQFPHFVLQAREFIDLDPHAKALMMYFAAMFKGYNNGDFSAPNNRYKDAGFNSADTLQKAKRALIDSGFAVVTRQGQRRKCSLYGLTIWPVDECEGKLEWPSERKASHAWKTVKSDGRPAAYKVADRRPITLKEAA